MTIATFSFGQQTENPDEKLTVEERATKHTTRMKEELTLTESQEKEIYQINVAHISQMDVYRQEQKALREKMKAEREATKAKIKAVLTEEQRVIFEQKEEERRKKKEEHKKNNQPRQE